MSLLVRHRTILALSILALGVGLLPAPFARAADGRVVVAHATTISASDQVERTGAPVTFSVALTSAHASDLQQFLSDVTNPSSPQYHHFLTATQFATRFGASPESITRVRNYFAQFGVRAHGVSRGHVLLHLSGSTQSIAHALAARVVAVRHPSGDVAAVLRSVATMPASVAHDVAGIAGLGGTLWGSHSFPRTGSTNAPSEPSTLGCDTSTTGLESGSTIGQQGLSVMQQAVLYGLDHQWSAGNDGTGQTIGVYELAVTNSSDLTNFAKCYWPPSKYPGIVKHVSYVNVDNGPSDNLTVEATMDVEEVMALAPGASITVYQGPNNAAGTVDTYARIADDATAENPGPTVISVSWGLCEADPTGAIQAEAAIFNQMAAEGKSVIASAGDGGAYDCAGQPNTVAVDDPASQPLVTGVGGLTVTGLNPVDYSNWSSGGGGISTVWGRPSYQTAPGMTDNTPPQSGDPMRLVPDLAVMADSNTGFVGYFTQGSDPNRCVGWCGIGGTSIGSPIVSAIVATAQQACPDVAPFGPLNPALYSMSIGNTNGFTAGFTDVVNGSGNGVYKPDVGYDLVTGLGAPNPDTFVSSLCAVERSFAASATTTTTSTTTTTQPVLTKPGVPTWKSATALRAGLQLVVFAPTVTGGTLGLSYSYSLTGGRTWVTVRGVFLPTQRVVTIKVSNLPHNKVYTVAVRAQNVVGSGPASPFKTLKTK